jgi:hypothetical protein
MRPLLKPSSDNLRQPQRNRRAQFVPFFLAKKSCFLRFCLSAASSYQDKIADFFRGEARWQTNFLLPTECRFIELPHSRCVAAINLNFTDL